MKTALFAAVLLSILPTAVMAGDTEIIVESYPDGYNSAMFSTEGKWPESAAKSKAPGLRATKAVYNDANADVGAARFVPDIPVAGQYEVFATYPPSGNASGVIYKVVSADGEKSLTIDQNGRVPTADPKPDRWFSLGTYRFEQGTKGRIEVIDPGTGAFPNEREPNKRLYADAVRLVPKGIQLPANYTNKLGTGVAGTQVASLQAPTAPPVTLPAVPSSGGTAATAPTGIGLPPLPGAPGAPSLPRLDGSASSGNAATPAPSLPALPGTLSSSATPALPALPGSGAPDPALPALPGSNAPAPGLPSLPTNGNTASAPLPSLPSSGGTASVPALPPLPGTVGSASAPSLPSLPASSGTASAPSLPALPGSSSSPSAPELPSLSPLPGSSGDTLPPPPSLGGTPATIAALSGTPAVGGSAPAGAGITLGTPVPEANNPSGLPWSYDYGTALSMAANLGKKLLVFFVAKGNRQAIAYETRIFSHPSVRPLLDNFVLVKLDFPSDTRRAFGLGIYGAGRIAITDPSGTKLGSIEQMPESPEAFAQQLQKYQ